MLLRPIEYTAPCILVEVLSPVPARGSGRRVRALICERTKQLRGQTQMSKSILQSKLRGVLIDIVLAKGPRAGLIVIIFRETIHSSKVEQ